MAQSRPLAIVIGKRLADLRERELLTQDDVARELQRVGLPWHRSTVAQVEAGNREVTFAELVLLSYLFKENLNAWLEDAHGRVPKDDLVQLADHAYVDQIALRGLLKGDEPRLWRRAKHWNLRGMGEGPATDVAGEAEVKVARRLGITVDEVVARSKQLWAMSLTEKRDALVREAMPPQPAAMTAAESAQWRRSLQAVRGHVTRMLMDGIEAMGDDQEANR